MGQPTTLQITVTGQPVPKINWTKKDGDPVDHIKVLQDNSLYINPTTEDDQGNYKVTATNNEGSSNKTIQLIVLNPQFIPCKLCSHYYSIATLSLIHITIFNIYS